MKNAVPLISVIIVNHNGRRWLHACLSSLFHLSYSDLEIILVDNASTDGSLNFVDNNYRKVTTINLDKNLGFGKANNIGVKKSRGELIFFLNNDTKIKQNTFFEKLVLERAKFNYNLCSPRILNESEKDPSHGRFLGVDFLGYPGISKRPFYVEGCSLLISRKDFDALRGFDDAYFMYGEDIDLSWRARLLGMTVGVCESAKLIHYGGGSSTRVRPRDNESYAIPIFRRYEVEKNALRTLLKNYSFGTLVLFLPIYFSLVTIESIVYTMLGNLKVSKKMVAAVWWNLRHASSTLKERDLIQQSRRINDRQILKLMDRRVNKIVAFKNIGLPKFQ